MNAKHVTVIVVISIVFIVSIEAWACYDPKPSRPVLRSPADDIGCQDTGGVRLRWYDSSGETSYNVYLEADDEDPDVLVATLGRNVTYYDTGSLSSNKTYYWKVQAVNAYGSRTSLIWKFHTYPLGDVTSSVSNVTQGKGYCTIQAAIDDANDGDTIEVAEGTYYENDIDFNGKAITLTSTDPNDPCVVSATIIDANGSYRAVYFCSSEEPNSVITGFTITGGSSQGVRCSNASPTIEYCNISDNGGYGMYYSSMSAQATVKNCIISHNSGYGIRCGSDGKVLVANCTVAGNTTYGIYGSIMDVEVKNCIIWDNDNDLYGPYATYSCIQDEDSGIGNFHTDPCFVSEDTNDFHLSGWSRCIDAGDTTSDYSNEPNGGGGRVNMGAYGNTEQATVTTDADSDGLPDEWQEHYWPDYDPCDPDPNYGPSGNPDTDDFNNLVEYLFDYDPNSADTGKPMEIGVVYFSTSQIDPLDDETVTINYPLNMNADVNVSFRYAESGGTGETIRTISRTNMIAGLHQVVWDGTDDEGVIVKTYFYDVKIDANDGDGNTANWDSYSQDLQTDSTIDVSKRVVETDDFDPYQNIPVEITFYITDWGMLKVLVSVKDSVCCDQIICTVLDQDRLVSPGYHTVYWNGRWDNGDYNGQIYEGDFDVWVAGYFGPGLWSETYAVDAYVGPVVVYYEPEITNLRCNPYLILPLNDEVTTIAYDLAYDANITINITDPNGNYFTLIDDESQTAGLNKEVIWYGEKGDPNDPNTRYFSDEGVYDIEVKATLPDSTRVGAITVYK